MPLPQYQDLITLSSTGGGLQPESMDERMLSCLAMIASGTGPDGTGGAGLQPLPGLYPVPKGTALNTALIVSTQAAGYVGWYLDPRVIWDATAGLSFLGISNFIIQSYMVGSLQYSPYAIVPPIGYINTGSSSVDGVSVYGLGALATACSGIWFFGCAFIGSNPNGVVHYAGDARACRMKDCFLWNQLNTVTAGTLASDVQTTVAAGSNAQVPGTWTAASPGTLSVPSTTNSTISGAGFLILVTNTPGTAVVAYDGVTLNTSFNNLKFMTGDATGQILTGAAVNTAQFPFALNVDTQYGVSGAVYQENTVFQDIQLAAGYACIGIGCNDHQQRANDNMFQGMMCLSGSGSPPSGNWAPYTIIGGDGGGNTFVNFYDRSDPFLAQIYNHGARFKFFYNEQDQFSVAGGQILIQDQSRAVTTFVSATISANGTAQNIMSVSAGTVRFLDCFTNQGVTPGTITVSSPGVLDLSDQSSQLGFLSVLGTSGTTYVSPQYVNANTPTTSGFTGTLVTIPVNYPQVVAVASGSTFSGASAVVTWTPPTTTCLFRISLFLQVTVAGTSVIPVVAFQRLGNQPYSQNLPLIRNDGAATAWLPVGAIGTAPAQYQGWFTGKTGTAGTAVTLTLTNTGSASTFTYAMEIEQLSAT